MNFALFAQLLYLFLEVCTNVFDKETKHKQSEGRFHWMCLSQDTAWLLLRSLTLLISSIILCTRSGLHILPSDLLSLQY